MCVKRTPILGVIGVAEEHSRGSDTESEPALTLALGPSLALTLTLGLLLTLGLTLALTLGLAPNPSS